MTDRELLELAAKAAGYDISHPWNAERMMMPNPEIGLCVPDVSTCWNPLSDDGDAFRLAVKLRIDVCYENNDGPWHVNAWPRMPHAGCSEIADSSASTRHAIVRAAAEIGKDMK